MSVIEDNTVSSTMTCPFSVNFLGFHPKCCKYLPICCLDPKLNSGKSMRLNGPFTSFHCSPKNFRPTVETVLSFLHRGVISLTNVGRGRKVSCTLSSKSYFFSFSKANNWCAYFRSSSQPRLTCLLTILCTSCSNCIESTSNPSSSSSRCWYSFSVTSTSRTQYFSISGDKRDQSVWSPLENPRRSPHARRLCPPSRLGLLSLDMTRVSCTRSWSTLMSHRRSSTGKSNPYRFCPTTGNAPSSVAARDSEA